jgi:hypothetical protein
MYYAWKKTVMQDTTRNYYIDVWVFSQKVLYYQPESVTSFTEFDSCTTMIFCCSVVHGGATTK